VEGRFCDVVAAATAAAAAGPAAAEVEGVAEPSVSGAARGGGIRHGARSSPGAVMI